MRDLNNKPDTKDYLEDCTFDLISTSRTEDIESSTFHVITEAPRHSWPISRDRNRSIALIAAVLEAG